MLQRRWRASRPGLTLIEMVVVLVIIAALAMLIIPRLDFLKGQTDLAQSAAGSADVMSNIQTYKTTTGYYPLRLDSLFDGTGVYAGLWVHPGSSITTYLEPFTLTAAHVGSLAHAFGSDASGNTTVMDHDPASTDPANSGTLPGPAGRDVTTGGSLVRLVNSSSNASLIRAAGYADGVIPAGVNLVVLGVGPRNSMIGRTMQSCPRHAAAEVDEYGRFLAIFAVFDNGSAAQLRTVVDSRRSTIEARVNAFKKSGPIHE